MMSRSARVGDLLPTRRFPLAICCAVSLGIAALACAAQPHAERYPVKSIRLLVPQPPSGTADMLGRMIGQKLADALGQPVVIDNRPGASGTMGTDMVAKAPADGYTILMTYSTHSTTPSLFKKLPYDPVKDFAPITIATSAGLMLVVNPAIPAYSVKDLIALAKAKPNQLNFGSASNGSGSHLAGELLKHLAGVQATHVPYRGTGPAITALIANEVQFMFAGLLPAQVQVKANRLRALAITSPKRSSFIPELPTVEESGLPGFEVVGWYGLLAPAGTPPAIVNHLNAEIVRILAQPDVKERIAGEGADVVGDSPAHFEAFLKTDIARWAKLIKASGAHID